ncbi:membrane-anchored junction protein isoform X1 [Etheostoma spectabile]|uniref:membrane-anchored junction protein isoform X1 n=2 Tax=Etheostoma spectabile TaxID=54343 RepID=UPI0013AEC3E2|nr:membrane-anchored junction protein isoform X1 [Etheostoma spectabile]
MLAISFRHYGNFKRAPHIRSAMPLQAFSFPCPETRFFKAGSCIYKFKIRGGSSFRGEKNMGGNCLNQELEDIIRTVLGNLDSLQPFSSSHFIVFPYRKRRKGASKGMCKHGEMNLRAYPFSLILYLEKNVQKEEAKQAEEKLSSEKRVAQQFPPVSEPQSKRHKSDSPLEEAILKDLIKDMVAESEVSVVGRRSLYCPQVEREVKEDPGHADKKGSKGIDVPQQKLGVNTVRGSWTAGEVHPGTVQSMGEEERDEKEENADSGAPGIWTRMASHIFPFSLFFRDP